MNSAVSVTTQHMPGVLAGVLAAAGLVAYGFASRASAAEPPDSAASAAGPEPITLTLVDPDATGYGTFQSHNQRVAVNRNGIFLTYLHWYVDPDSTWRMARSTDGGDTFDTVYEHNQHDTAHTPPAIETDEDDNIYLAFGDTDEDTFYLLRFLAGEDYATAHETKLAYAPCAAKYTMVYDRPRQRLHIGLQYGGFLSLGRDGGILKDYQQVYAWEWPGRECWLQYPYLHLDDSGTLYYAHTTVSVPEPRVYRSIICLKSPDGGDTWRRLDGTPVATPVPCDEGGEATTVTEPEDLSVNTWLGNTLTKGGRTHFWYRRVLRGEPPEIVYVNYDTASGQRHDRQNLRNPGGGVRLDGTDGFFASRDLGPESPLYLALSDDEGRVTCLRSENNGASWRVYARAEERHRPYAVSGTQRIGADGYIMGAYTAGSGPDGRRQIWFFRIATGEQAQGKQDPGA